MPHMKVPDNGPSDFDIDQVRGFVSRSIEIKLRDNPLAFDHLQGTLATLNDVLDVLHHTRNALLKAVDNDLENEAVKHADRMLRRMKRLTR
jgi:hypothetical protein